MLCKKFHPLVQTYINTFREYFQRKTDGLSLLSIRNPYHITHQFFPEIYPVQTLDNLTALGEKKFFVLYLEKLEYGIPWN